MCIIAIKDKGIKLPNEKTLETMFWNNSDGAGFMYAKDGKVVIRKGFMTFRAFKSALDGIDDVDNLPLVMHFRIATSGNVDAGTTHPFPISNRRKVLRKTNYITDVGVCHNGIIPISAPKNMSDTMQYIAEKLYYYQKLQKDFFVQRSYMKRIQHEIQSKMVFLTGTGDIFKIGEFISEDDGMVYSNTSYKEKSFLLFDNWFDTDYFSSALLCPIEGYIQDFEGNLIDCCDDDIFLMDKYNNVYQYDYECDCAEQIYANAFTYSGLPYVFDEEQAMYINIGV